jgi:hypothetical protein
LLLINGGAWWILLFDSGAGLLLPRIYRQKSIVAVFTSGHEQFSTPDVFNGFYPEGSRSSPGPHRQPLLHCAFGLTLYRWADENVPYLSIDRVDRD